MRPLATRITTVELAKALPGKAFIKKGLIRIVTRVDKIGTGIFGAPIGEVYWKRPGGKERKLSQWLPYFDDWLCGAEDYELHVVKKPEKK